MAFIIGDIHGEITKLRKLLSFIGSKSTYSEIVFIGDYIDKGENSKATLDFLCELSKEKDCTFLLGNHDYYWINCDLDKEKYLLKYGAQSTIRSFNGESVFDVKQILLKEYASFFKGLLPFWMNEEYIVVHSGISPEYYHVKPDHIPLEAILFNRYNFLKHEGLFLDKYKVIFGHTGFYSPFSDGYKLGIDTSACYFREQPLTAFCTKSKNFIDSNGNKYHIEVLQSNQCPVIPRNKPWRENDRLAK